MSDAPFIPPPSGRAAPPKPWRVFGTRAYFRLWLAQVFSSLGDWVGLFAILAIASRVSNNSASAVSLVMVAKLLPGFFLATVGGVVIDRFDRRRVMVVADVGRAGLYALLPFFPNLAMLVAISFVTEVLTLLWGSAKDASLPNLVNDEQLASANSLSMVASYGTFPLGGVVFSGLAVLATWIGHFNQFSSLRVDKEVLALWADAGTYVFSAFMVLRLPIRHEARHEGRRIDWTQTLREVAEGLRFIRSERMVSAVMLGLGGGLFGAGAMIPLGPVFASEVLGSATQFGVLMTSLGVGAAAGVTSFLALQKRIPRESAFSVSVVSSGLAIVAAASFSVVWVAALLVVVLGACAGTGYVTGFTIMQERVADEIRGRTFATLNTVVRVCLLVSLTVSPLFADLFNWISKLVLVDRSVSLGDFAYGLPGVRLALWGGGLVTTLSGLVAHRQVRRAMKPSPGGAGT
ncbi:MAG: MFS transporter [Acidimicrobiia bacterium]|nr:MFS transporter [Acidimicrobiia bacterium]MCL4291849.1 MFS transporter [Acidimicrobiia bacterium]